MTKKILIASVLKPVDDVRHYEKLALSIAKANKYQIIIFGKGTDKKSPYPNITFRPTGNFGRKSLNRISVQFRFVSCILKAQPNVLLITTPELLPVSVFLKYTLRYKLIYDIQENYVLNLTHQKEYGRFERLILLPLISWIQKKLTKQVDHFLLAEKTYTKELGFIKDRYSVLENKALGKVEKLKPWKRDQTLNMVFSGTLSYYSGVQRAIEVFLRIKDHYPKSQLIIIGTYPQKEFGNQIRKLTSGISAIDLQISSRHVVHEKILAAIRRSDLGIIAYLPDHVNQFKVPTKVFEYAHLGLPYIIHEHWPWVKRAKELGGEIPVNLSNFEPENVLRSLKEIQDWDREPSQWKREEKVIQELISTLIE